jgi:hypothetical protein
MSNAIQAAPTSGLLTPEQITTLAHRLPLSRSTRHQAIVEVFATACKRTTRFVSIQKGDLPRKVQQQPGCRNTTTLSALTVCESKRPAQANTPGIDDPKYNVQANGGFDTSAMVKASR